jgi:hypothetical protein
MDPLTLQRNQLIQYAAGHNRLVEEVPNDGNCLYEAITKQLSHRGIQTTAYSTRCHMINEVMENQELYEIGIQAYYQNVAEWFGKNSKMGDWGDETSVTALQKALNLNIVVISSNGPAYDRQYPAVFNTNLATIWLGHRVEQHYVSLVRGRIGPRKGDG